MDSRFNKAINKVPRRNINKRVVQDLAKKYKVDYDKAVKFLKDTYGVELNEDTIELSKDEMDELHTNGELEKGEDKIIFNEGANLSDLKYQIPLSIEDELGISPKAFKSIKKKGKDYALFMSSYMSSNSIDKLLPFINKALGTKLKRKESKKGLTGMLHVIGESVLGGQLAGDSALDIARHLRQYGIKQILKQPNDRVTYFHLNNASQGKKVVAMLKKTFGIKSKIDNHMYSPTPTVKFDNDQLLESFSDNSKKSKDQIKKTSEVLGMELVGELEEPSFSLREAKVIRYFNEYIKKQGEKWVVQSKAGKTLGTHDTKQDAIKQLAAVEASKNK
jgi:hypothetical protein